MLRFCTHELCRFFIRSKTKEMRRSFASEWTHFLPTSSFHPSCCCACSYVILPIRVRQIPVFISFRQMKDALCSVWHVNVVSLCACVCVSSREYMYERLRAIVGYTHLLYSCWRCWFEFITLAWFDWLICYALWAVGHTYVIYIYAYIYIYMYCTCICVLIKALPIQEQISLVCSLSLCHSF